MVATHAVRYNLTAPQQWGRWLPSDHPVIWHRPITVDVARMKGTIVAGVPALRLSRLVLLLALAAGAVLRIWLNIRSNWMIDGDEAVYGIGALRVLRGERPIFFYGEPYMGMITAYLAAPLVALLGPTPIALRLITLTASLCYVTATWCLALRLYGPRVAAVAVLFSALPSIYTDVFALKALGSYEEVMVAGTVMMLGVLRCRREGTLSLTRWSGLGLLTGMALWANFLVIYYLVTALLLLPWRSARQWMPEALLGGMSGVVAGSLPVWLYNLQHGWATMHFLFDGARVGGESQYRPVARVLGTTLLPRVVGATSPWSNIPTALGAGLLVLAVAAVLLAVVTCARLPAASTIGGQPEPLLLFLAVTLAIYLFSGFGRPSLSPFDASGRYLLPIWTALPVLLAALCVRIAKRSTAIGAGLIAVVVLATMYGHVTGDPRLLFQSPYWTRLPLDSRPLLTWLRREDIHEVWINHWAGNPLMFASDDTIVAADYYDIVAGHGPNRFPAEFNQARAAPRAAYVVVTTPGEITPLERRLNELHVVYDHAELLPYQVFVPISRRVDPAEVVEALAYPY